jgi:hypothetical protein
MLRHGRPLPLIFVAGLIAAFLGVFVYWIFPRSISGDEFKARFDESGASSATSWQLYSDSVGEYCFKLTRGLIPPARYCVAKTDLRVKSSGPIPRFLYYGELELPSSRRPGAAQVDF